MILLINWASVEQPTFANMVESVDPASCPDALYDHRNESTRNEHAKGKSLRVLLRTESHDAASADPGPPPDGGALAWTQVLVGHLIIMNTW